MEPSHISRALIGVYGSVTGAPNIDVECSDVRLCLRYVSICEMRWMVPNGKIVTLTCKKEVEDWDKKENARH